MFQGEVLPVAALLDAARATPDTLPNTAARIGVRHTAAQNANASRSLLADGESLDGCCWRFCILQTLDGYTSVLRRGAPDLAAGVFTDEPPRTGSAPLDGAFAALADRDGWPAPAWASDLSRRTETGYLAVPLIFRGDADKEEPGGVPSARDSHRRPFPGEGMTPGDSSTQARSKPCSGSRPTGSPPQAYRHSTSSSAGLR